MQDHNIKKLRKHEQGFASIVIAFVLIIVLSLLTVAFAQLARREQQNALDKQLAVQANYAAESGINDIVSKLSALQTLNTSAHPIDSKHCFDLSSIGLVHKDISTSTGVAYTCALINLEPGYLQKKPFAAGTSWFTQFSTDKALDSLTINWDSTGSYPDSSNKFLPADTWSTNNYPAVLQFSITPLNAVDRNALIDNTMTVYLYPTQGKLGTISYTTVSQPSSQNGAIVDANCQSGSGGCSASITKLTGGTGPYLVHLIDYYTSNNGGVKITGADAGGGPVKFLNGQAQIDVTGKARNVLKRLQVTISLNSDSTLPAFALEAQNICKRQLAAPFDAANNPQGTTFDLTPATSQGLPRSVCDTTQ